MKFGFTLAALCCATLTACHTPAPAAPLAGEWQATEAQHTALTSPKARLTFDDQQQRFSAYAGCNRLFGTYQQQGNSLKIGAVASTMMMCEPHMMAQDKQLASALENSVQYRIQGQQLELLNAQGNIVLKAHR